MSYSERNMHRRSIMFALCGLVFACLSGGLIIITFRPTTEVPRTVVMETQSSDNKSIAVVVVVNTRWVRGNRRRRLRPKSNEMDPPTRTMSNRTAATPPPNTVASSNPTPSPIVQPASTSIRRLSSAVTEGKPNDTKNTTTTTTTTVHSTGSASTIVTESIAAAMVGVASSIVICSLGLYCSDLRQRRRHDKWTLANTRRPTYSDQHHPNDHDVLEDDNSSQKSALRSRTTGVGDSESMTSVASTHEGTSTSGHLVQNGPDGPMDTSTSQELVEYKGGGAAAVVVNHRRMLPPMIAHDVPVQEEPCNDALALTLIPNDDASISRVSTLTMSLKDGGYSYGGSIEEKLSRYAIESSSDVTELDDAHRVSDGTKLTSLVKGGTVQEDASVCSSLTNGSQSSVRLLGEDCLEAKFQHTPDTTPFASLEVSPDTPLVEEEDDMAPGPDSEEDDDDFTIDSHELEKKNELVQLEQLLAGIPNDEMSHGAPAAADDVPCDPRSDEPSHQARVRDVCFLPIATDGKMYLGLELLDASSDESFPTVSNVQSNSPLVGLLIIGDAIVAINERSTRGLSSVKVLEMIDSVGFSPNDDRESEHAPPKMFKLTVMGSKPNDDDDSSDGQLSLDLESATEV